MNGALSERGTTKDKRNSLTFYEMYFTLLLRIVTNLVEDYKNIFEYCQLMYLENMNCLGRNNITQFVLPGKCPRYVASFKIKLAEKSIKNSQKKKQKNMSNMSPCNTETLSTQYNKIYSFWLTLVHHAEFKWDTKSILHLGTVNIFMPAHLILLHTTLWTTTSSTTKQRSTFLEVWMNPSRCEHVLKPSPWNWNNLCLNQAHQLWHMSCCLSAEEGESHNPKAANNL